jgi:hypothetical protein
MKKRKHIQKEELAQNRDISPLCGGATGEPNSTKLDTFIYTLP